MALPLPVVEVAIPVSIEKASDLRVMRDGCC